MEEVNKSSQNANAFNIKDIAQAKVAFCSLGLPDKIFVNGVEFTTKDRYKSEEGRHKLINTLAIDCIASGLISFALSRINGIVKLYTRFRD